MKPLARHPATLLVGLAWAGSACLAQTPAAAPPARQGCPSASAGGSAEAQGWLAPKLSYFNTSGGVGGGTVHYLDRYDYREGILGGSTREGGLADIDLRLLYTNDCRDLLLLERDGHGGNNQQTRLQGQTDALQLKAHHGVYTSATGGIDFLYNPDRVAGGTDPAYKDPSVSGESPHVGDFHYDSPGVTAFKLTRTTQGVSLALKPEVLNGRGSVELSYNGYRREGNQPVNYVLPKSLFAGSLAEAQQWRGYSKPVDEKNSNLAFNLSYTPRESWLLNYEFSVDKFENGSRALTLGALSQLSGIPLGSGGNPHFIGSPDLPFNYTANSTQLSSALRLSKQFEGAAALGAGVSLSRLQQDSFTAIQAAAGYTNGNIGTDSAYLTGRFNVARSVGLDAFWRYSRRQNNSSYPVAGFYDPVSLQSEERMVAPRLNSLESQTYGLEARIYPSLLKTHLALGWTHTDKQRELTWGVVPVVPPEMTLYRVQSRADEVFVKLVARPAQGWTVRVTPSYLWSSQTGLVTEPEELFKLKTQLSYSKPERQQLLVSGYFNYSDAKNGLLGFSDYTVTGAGGAGVYGATQPGVFGPAQLQQVGSTFRAGGLNLSWEPAEAMKTQLGYDWNQTDFSTYYFSSNRVRYHYLLVPGNNILTSTDILALDRARSKVDTHGLYAQLEQPWRQFLFAAGYSVTWAQGQTGSGLAGQTLPAVDDRVDNTLQTLSLGLEYRVRASLSLHGGLILDDYRDRVYSQLSGGRSTVLLGMSVRL